MNAVALLFAVYVLPVLFAHMCHEVGKARKAPRATHPPDADDPNFDSMWEAARR